MERRESWDAELWDEKVTGISCWVRRVERRRHNVGWLGEHVGRCDMLCGAPGGNGVDKGGCRRRLAQQMRWCWNAVWEG